MNTNDSSWNSFVEAPLALRPDEKIEWDDEADVVIVGFGAAGATAAIEARQQGQSVIVLDRFQGGGATVLSGGVVYAGGGTRQQKESGIEDSPDNMFRYLQTETQGCVSDELLREFCENSAADMEWLESLGLDFPGNATLEKTSYPHNPHFLYYSGNEGNPANKPIATPAPRGHRHRSGGQAGNELFSALKKATYASGARVTLQTKVTRLIVDENNQVIGVEAKQMKSGTWAARVHALTMKVLNKFSVYGIVLILGRQKHLEKLEAEASITYRVKCNKGVVLASGGFINNRQMKDHYLPKYNKTMINGSIGCDGSGIHLGQSMGGDTRLMERASAWRFINPPLSLAKGIVVNAKGERYCNEGAYGAQIGYQMCEFNDGVGWVILDEKLYKEAKREIMPWKMLFFQTIMYTFTLLSNRHKGESIEELAEHAGFDKDTFTKNIDDYNKVVRGEAEDPHQKSTEFLQELNQGPYYAINISKDSPTFPLPIITFGGLSVDEQTRQVQREDGSLVDGLYAVGRAAASLPSNHYMSGFSIADCVFTGRKAARAVANLS
jgi:3-oxo-5alpha-steroid 4-dehydrogenase